MDGAYIQTYLLNRQADSNRLRRRAYEKFAIALRSGRMIAFTGSYASQHLGYDSWGSMSAGYLDSVEKKDPQLVAQLKAMMADNNRQFDDTDLMDIAELSAHLDRHVDVEAFNKNREDLASKFALPKSLKDFGHLPDVSSALIHDLGLRRIITLNYDLEHEWTAFVGPQDKSGKDGQQRKDILDSCFGGKGPVRKRVVPGFGPVVSEVLGRKQSAELISFALHDDDTRCRILHLHGRKDCPETMIVSRRDYRDLYWQNGFSRLPFEYGLRTILSGNPILFVGLGMSEQEIMKHFEQFLSDNPNRRSVPMFLLWKSQGNANADRALRLLFNRKLGVSVLFDKEIAEISGKADEYVEALAKAPDEAISNGLRLELPLRYLAQWCRTTKAQLPVTDDIRNPQLKFKGGPERINIWHAEMKDPPSLADESAREVAAYLRGLPAMLVVTGKAGSGRGSWTETFATSLLNGRTNSTRVVVINGSFATETDSIFAILSGAYDGQTAFEEAQSRLTATMQMHSFLMKSVHSQLSAEPDGEVEELVIIINGMERFVAHNGTALSTELDMLIRFIPNAFAFMHPNMRRRLEKRLRLILVGSPRLLRYVGQVAPGSFKELQLVRDSEPKTSSIVDPETGEKFRITSDGPTFFEHLAGNLHLSASPPTSVDATVTRQEFLARVAEHVGKSRPNMAFAILRSLAFIGQPVERHVLAHVVATEQGKGNPETKDAFKDRIKEVDTELDWLIANGMVLNIESFPGQVRRVGMHKALVAEIRERYGVPLSDARLAAGFNLGLFAAQPLNSVLPEQEWHDELARMVDFLCGQYQDPSPVLPLLHHLAVQLRRDNQVELKSALLHDLTPPQIASMSSARQADCLRAALSLMRSYFSTSSLLMQGNHGLDVWLRNAPLTDHADRLRRLIRLHDQGSLLRGMMRAKCPPKDLDKLNKQLGSPAFYADDLCWLYNELGVVLVTQGKLIEAREALEQAQAINTKWIEFGERHHNWRRIAINLVQVSIDQGMIEGAEELLREVETAIENDARLVLSDKQWKSLPGGPYDSFRDYALRHFSKRGGSRSTRAVDQYFPANLFLGIGLVMGYRGVCQHLRGALAPAENYFKDAIRLMELLGEQRAFAIFQRHNVSLLRQLRKMDDALEAQRLCVSSAGPSRQTDIDHSGRIALGEHGYLASREQEQWHQAQMLPQLKETLRYATACDMYRLQIEALQQIAFLQLKLGDTDSAFEYVSDASAIAARNGFGLRKIGLRMLLGRILASRNEKDAARIILAEASKLGTRIGYARAAEVSEDELVKLEADRVDMPQAGTRRD
ncbi:hypothetical protein GCM10009127_13120 [Alteraurantiacibacter aestuarii]|uniref:SIR2-like domain-containing protein n=1 Tax=Alteraurantiacibacter aestuarii TaxID=650004 RepID=A0A844ZJY7_9SPHN|nr:SIR2 family protein [Alteraurantiacibacter aestuarii]MXO88098.1 hypothetical protein [Alteraurantiacibacter aestuarii]